MSVSFRVLGVPGSDNALAVRVDRGQSVQRVQFDCGACMAELSPIEIRNIDYLLFSHLHLDHVAGFDWVLRAFFARALRPMYVWGPPRTAEIVQHRLRGCLWNLYQGQPGAWIVSDIEPPQIVSRCFEVGEAFATAHPGDVRAFAGTVLSTPDFTITARVMDHLTPSMAYVLREQPHRNIDTAQLERLGLRPGPWLAAVKAPAPDDDSSIVVDGRAYQLGALRAALLAETPGESVAYLTDFRLDAAAQDELAGLIRGCTTVICESQYLEREAALAAEYHHMTARQAAALALRAGVQQLVLFHVSDRYRRDELLQLRDEARAIFPNTNFPEHWGV
jgi:ribonuclease Z